MRENPLADGAPPRTPLGSLQRSPDPLAGGRGWLPLRLQEPHHALGPSGLQPWPFGPRCLPSQIRFPKSAYVVNWTYFTPSPSYNPLYNRYIIVVNPDSLRPYHNTLGPAAGPVCSKILPPPLPPPKNFGGQKSKMCQKQCKFVCILGFMENNQKFYTEHGVKCVNTAAPS